MNFCKSKFRVVLAIMGLGMMASLLFHYVQTSVFGRGYPYNSFLDPVRAYTDYTDVILASGEPNPYFDPSDCYSPFTYVLFRLPALFPQDVGMIGFFFFCLAGLTLLLVKTLENIVENPWLRVGVSLLLLCLNYPLLYCIDRGNIEILLALCYACCLYFFSTRRYLAGTLWLLPAICCKIYTVMILTLLVRQRKWALLFAAVACLVVLSLVSVNCFAVSPRVSWDLYSRNLAGFQATFCDDNYLDASSSPWVTYKLALIAAAEYGFISPVEFDSGGPFISASYAVYRGCTVLFALLLAVYACFLEKEFLRCAIPFLLFISMAFPTGADYRMIYASIALAILVQLKAKRPGDWLALILIAFVLVPKKVLFFSFLAYPSIHDISIQVILNPVCLLTATAVLLYGSYRNFDPRWTALRFKRIVRSAPLVGKLWHLPPVMSK